MIIINKHILEQGHIDDSIVIRSFNEYKAKGGKHDILDTYAHFKEKAKEYELKYIQMMDMKSSGIDLDEKEIRKCAHIAQAFWYILHLWFNKPLRVVKFSTFSLEEFNKL